MFASPIDPSQLPLECFQSSRLRTLIETELSIVVLDAVGLGKEVSVVQEQAIHDAVVPAIFFRALESGKVGFREGDLTMNDIGTEFLQWMRLEVRKAVLNMLGLDV